MTHLNFVYSVLFLSLSLSLTSGFITSERSPPGCSQAMVCFATPTDTPTDAMPTSTASQGFDSYYYEPVTNAVKNPAAGRGSGRVTLQRFLSHFVKNNPEYKDLKNIYLAVQMACKTISHLVNRAGLVLDTRTTGDNEDFSDGRFYSMKRLDKLSTSVMKNALKFTGTVQMVVPEAKMDSEIPEQHQPGVLIAYDKNYMACLDPMVRLLGDGFGMRIRSLFTSHFFVLHKSRGWIRQC